MGGIWRKIVRSYQSSVCGYAAKIYLAGVRDGGVADATLQTNGTVELRTYIKAGLRQYWMVNLIDRQLEIYTPPPRRHLANTAFHAAGRHADSPLLGEVAVDQFLPRATGVPPFSP